jgi:hypothetical protein
MVLDILIAFGIALSQLAITWYGVHISVRENRIRNAIIIGIVGLAGITLTVLGTIRNGVTQRDLVSRLAKIQEYSKPESDIELDMITPGYTVGPFVEGKRAFMFVYWVNRGTLNVVNLHAASKLYMGPDNSDGTQEAIINDWMTISGPDLLNKTPAATLSRGGTARALVSAYGPTLSREDLDNLHTGKTLMYLVSQLTFFDKNGYHDIQRCGFLQPPAWEPDFWHYCRMFNQRK